MLATEGRIIAPINVNEGIQTLLLEHINSAGYNVVEIQADVTQLEMGSIVPNWDEYVVL